MLNVVMLNVIYAECHKKALYAECGYAECRYAECRYAVSLCRVSLCRVSLCRVSLYKVSLCRVSLCGMLLCYMLWHQGRVWTIPIFIPTFYPPPPCACGGGWTQTLDFGTMRRVFYHCATAALFYYLSMHNSTKLSEKLQFPKACSIFSTIVFVFAMQQ
jgi:hypothetical protein